MKSFGASPIFHGARLRGFMHVSELRHVAAHMALIIPDSDASVGVDDEIVPVGTCLWNSCLLGYQFGEM
ncbi:hypothetical protein X759_30060 [Mesorhizobium sp. LSHC420B00]|nr:hypothetical protein X759_30060 [Mesorhizobium sp. LSHC420B00]